MSKKLESPNQAREKEIKVHQYEGMFVLGANLSDEAKERIIDSIKLGITSRGGQILKEHNLGRKRLAYKIGKNSEGSYYLYYFEVDSSLIKDMWREYKLLEEEGLLRFMTLRQEKIMEKVEFPQLQQA